MTDTWAAVVLAAGKGVRMRSRRAKVLHEVAGKPIIQHIIGTLRTLPVARIVVVFGHQADAVRTAAGPGVEFAEQTQQLGTGDALRQAAPLLNSVDGLQHLLVVNGDVPLVTPDTLQQLMQAHQQQHAAVTITTCVREDPTGLGRVLRASGGGVQSIIEEADATAEQRTIQETNEGLYCFDATWVWGQLSQLSPHKSGEYYLVDLVAAAAAEGRTVASVACRDPQETAGINDRVQLAAAEAALRARIREQHMRAGVTIIDPASTFIDAGVAIAEDTTIYPNTMLQGHTTIGPDCRIGPGCIIRDSTIAEGCHIVASMLEEAVVEPGVTIGPFCHLRPGAHLEADVHLGNYVEVKNSRVGRRTQIGHFSYIGDAMLGADVNIGAGTITVNYDGKDKHATVIGDGAFIGSDSMLIAPINIGAKAKTAAGSVVTHDVPPGTLVVGVPARPRAPKAAPDGGAKP